MNGEAVVHRADELLGLLRQPVPDEHKPKTWRGLHPWYRRQVYVVAGLRAWFVTDSPSLTNPDYAPFADADIVSLVERGEITSAYPGTDSAGLAFVWVGPDH